MKKRHSQNLVCAFSSYQYSLQMVHFMLHDFCCKTGELLFLFMEIFIFIADFDPVMAPAGAAAGKGETALFRFVGGRGSFCYLRIVHEKKVSIVRYGNDGLRAADHVGRQAHTVFTVSGQGVIQVSAFGRVLPSGFLCLPLKE